MNELSDELKKAKWLFAQECNFIAGASKLETIPDFNYPEVAFIGRSNVGKSSLINSLTNRSTLARVSHTPGRTKQLNFFLLANQLILVDLPGYGYAKASKGEIKGWNALINHYLKARPVLKRACLLIDARHGIKDSDEKIMDMLDEVAVNYQIILTKTDKCTRNEVAEKVTSLESLMSKHPAMHPSILLTSSRYLSGIDDLKIELASFA
jgi:GTP-binding protein